MIALNLSYIASQKLFATASYSNFQTFMNIRSQFESINQITQFQNIDTLNYSQITQNANFNINYVISKNTKRNQNFNLNLNYLDAADKQGGIIKYGNASLFFNAAGAYTILFVPKEISITAAYNASYNTIGKDDYITLGPTLAVNSKLFKSVSASLVNSYNRSTSKNVFQNSVFNTRVNLAYTLMKKHIFGLSLMNQQRSVKGRKDVNDLVGTIGYNFSF